MTPGAIISLWLGFCLCLGCGCGRVPPVNHPGEKVTAGVIWDRETQSCGTYEENPGYPGDYDLPGQLPGGGRP